MAAKSVRGDVNGTIISTENKPYFFDVSSFDENQVCLSCHPGGGPAEGIVQSNGTVIPYDALDPSQDASHSFDRDFYTYDSMDIVKASFADTIANAIAAVGDPRPVDWNKSGVMEADCMLCHIDPETPLALQCADGLKVFPNRPRMMIFADGPRDASGAITEITTISLGTPTSTGLMARTALSYTNDAQRMSRPTPMLALMTLPKDMVGEMMQMWMDGLHAIEDANASGVGLPFALYGENVAKIWDPQTGMLKPEYCANPNGVMDEMNRLAANRGALMNLFSGFLTYLHGHGFPDLTMDQMMDLFFNDFIYAYNIKNGMDPSGNSFMPIPLPLRAYEPGKFYTDWDNPNASVRDYVRAPLIEGSGLQYIGKTGMVWNATMAGMMNGQSAKQVLDAIYSSNATIQGELHEYLPAFFDVMPSAELMGIDLDQDGSPICYVRLVKIDTDNDGTLDDWEAKVYWEVDEVTYQSIHREMFGGGNDVTSHKWTKVCGQCHIMTKDSAAGVEHARLYNLGMPADWVKNGAFINFTDDEDAAGYDVHMSSGKMGCGSCHLKQSDFHTTKDLEELHNFLKGTDTAHMQRNDLDNAYRPKTCERCHLTDKEGLNPLNTLSSHEAVFGESTAVHLEEIACQTCHIPFKKTWRFRAFDDTLGYYGNFDNRMGYDMFGTNGTNPTMEIMAYPGPFAISPVYGTSPGYGIPHFNMVAQHVDSNGNNVTSMDYVSQMVDYFHMTKEGDPGRIVNGMPTNPRFDFWKFFYQMNLNQFNNMTGGLINFDSMWDNEVLPPLYWANGQNGYPQIVIGNPITIMTWVDAGATNGTTPNVAYGGARVLYVRELNAAVQEYQPPTQLGRTDFNFASQGCASYTDVGKVILKPTASYPDGYVLCDHTGDMYPDIWSVEDVRAVQEALTDVLAAEGAPNPQPMIFMAAHFFSDTHGVQPKEKALGAQNCNDCHSRMGSDGHELAQDQPGAHRITDRVINFLPWQPEWFDEQNRALAYNITTGQMEPTGENGTDGNGAFFIVDGEVAYIEAMAPNNVPILGANASEILHLSEHHAEELFYLNGEDTVLGTAIPGVNQMFLTDSEKHETYVNQVANGPDDLLMYVQVPEELKPHLTEVGYVQFKQYIDFRAGRYTYGGEAYVFRLGIEDGHFNGESIFAYLPIPEKPQNYQWAWPMLVKQDDRDARWHRVDAGPWACARIVGAFPGYVKVKIYGSHGGSGRYAAVYAVQDVDADGDGYPASIDCNDSDASIHPGAIDDCTDNIDNDCDGVAASQDACGVCDEDMSNDNTTCLDCAGVPNGGAVEDACGVCGGDNSTCLDCAGIPNGGHITDNCGNCVLPQDACQTDCNGDVNGTAYFDNCGVCVGGNTGKQACTQDCNGVWGGDATLDACGICDNDPTNDNSTCIDCAGVPNGNATMDNCGVCDTDPNNDCQQDCNGEWGGTAFTDACGNCVGGSTGYEPCGVNATEPGGNGTLIWQYHDTEPLTYDQVFHVDGTTICDDVTDGNYTDWRLPTVDELQSIYDANTPDHHIPGLEGHLGPYWTSEEDTVFFSGMWGVDFTDNSTSTYLTESLRVRCVRP